MSDLKQISTALERLFNEEGRRIVFWNDPDREFFQLEASAGVSDNGSTQLTRERGTLIE